jgi:hypothetical protein
MNIECPRQPDTPLTDIVRTWFSAPQEILEILRAIEP